ncbi:MAG: YibE/F family protein [Lachnospiraceae bacterium]|nr:YibE/F family protein [Lachnospiraceae bacterium]MDY5496547.1 YibE/F family protein [Anaerobutyricum sp.]
MKERWVRGGCLAAAGILFLLFFLNFRGIEKADLLETEGRDFEKAEVVKIIRDNRTESGNIVGNQTVVLKILSGKYKGKLTQATSSSSYLFGAHCKVGMKVIALINESEGEFVTSVYSENRGPVLWIFIGLFVAIVVLIGGKKGIFSMIGLAFTMLCILFVFLPMIYKGISPIAAAVFVIIYTTIVTMCLIDGISQKAVTAMLGTIFGVVTAGIFAWLIGKAAGITGYNVSDIENLVYVGEMTDIRIGELLFAGILISALGAVMDVGMSIASTLNELKINKKTMDARALFRSGMHVGRDMMGTMTNTLILAFTGGSINTLVFLYAYNYPYRQIINMYSVGIELMQGLSASLGVILAVPFTSAVGAWILGRSKEK